MGELDEAEECLRQGLYGSRELFGDHHIDTLISVDQVSLPFTFYLIREGENDRVKIRISRFYSTEFFEATLVFPTGNYTYTQLADEMRSARDGEIFSNRSHAIK